MSLRKRIGLGITLYYDAAGGTPTTLLASVVDTIDGPNAKAEIVNTPLLTDTFVEKIKGQIDGGEVNLVIAYDPDYADTVAMKALRDDTTTCPTWKVVYPNGTATDTFAAWLSGLNPTRKIGAYVTAAVTLAVNGNPG